MTQPKLTSEMIVDEVLAQWPETAAVFQAYKTACVGCSMAPFGTLADVAEAYDLDLADFMAALAGTIAEPDEAFKDQDGIIENKRRMDLAVKTNESESNDRPASEQTYTQIADLAGLLPDIPDGTILSRRFFNSAEVTGTLFSFAEGEELTEHTAARPAILHFLKGRARLTLGTDHFEAGEGTWVHMPAHLPHSILAETPVILLLLMLH